MMEFKREIVKGRNTHVYESKNTMIWWEIQYDNCLKLSFADVADALDPTQEIYLPTFEYTVNYYEE